MQHLTSVQPCPFDHIRLGLFILVYPLFKFLLYLLRSLFKHLISLQHFKRRYSCQDSLGWAVITGATDKIGFGFCKVLLKMGFNIVLISRNPQKLQSTVDQLNQIQKDAPQKSLLKTIMFDFAQSGQKGKVEAMMSELAGLDVCILVSNVGCSYTGLHTDASHQKIVELVHTNCTSMTLLTSRLIQRLASRNTRSAVINISSLAGTRGIPFLGLYSASKSFINRLSQGLSFEYPSVDIISLKTVLVESNMPKVTKSAFVPDGEEYALEALKELSIQRESFGMLSHNIIGYLYERLPDFFFKRLIDLFLKKVLFRRD